MTSRYAQKRRAQLAQSSPQSGVKVVTMQIPAGYYLYVNDPENEYYVLTDCPLQGEKGRNIKISTQTMGEVRIEFVSSAPSKPLRIDFAIGQRVQDRNGIVGEVYEIAYSDGGIVYTVLSNDTLHVYKSCELKGV